MLGEREEHNSSWLASGPMTMPTGYSSLLVRGYTRDDPVYEFTLPLLELTFLMLLPLFLRRFHRMIELFQLEKSFKIIKSNHQLLTRIKPCPEVPFPHVS